MSRSGNRPTLCVSLITYNQRAFIAQAIDSVLMQRTDFPVTLHIGDDCSTDDTQDLLRHYRDAHPGRIVLNLSDTRGGGRMGRENNVRNINSCRGADYIALLDGDDYWTDPTKLQRQVDFLEGNPAQSCVGHDAHRLYEDTGLLNGVIGEPVRSRIGRREAKAPFVDLGQYELFRFIPQTSTLCFRSSALPAFPDWFWQVPGADVAIAMLLAGNGLVRFDRRVMSIYRIHAASEWQRLTTGPQNERANWDDGNYQQLLRAFPAANRGRNRAQFEVLKMKRCFETGSTRAAFSHLLNAGRHDLPTLLTSAARVISRRFAAAKR